MIVTGAIKIQENFISGERNGQAVMVPGPNARSNYKPCYLQLTTDPDLKQYVIQNQTFKESLILKLKEKTSVTESIAKDLARMRDMMEFNDKTAKWKQKTDGSIQSDLVKSLKLVLLEGMKDTVGKNFFRDVIDHIRGLLFEPDEPKQFYAYILGNNDSNKSLGKDILIKYEDHIDISSGSSSSSGTSASSDSSIEDDGEGEPLADGPVTRSKSQSLPQAGRKDSYFIPEETVTKVADVVCITPLWSPDVQHCKMVIEIKSTTIMNSHET